MLETLSYSYNGLEMEGALALPANVTPETPAVLIAHTWMGVDDYVRRRATELAERGYIALALDIFGKNVRPQNTDEAVAAMTDAKADPKVLRGRLQAGFEALKNKFNLQPNRMAAIGFCFGGHCALEMARMGLPLAGVASFHGLLQTALPAAPGGIKASVLVLHGADDPMAPPAHVVEFLAEMKAAQADAQFVAYSSTVHSFTNHTANNLAGGTQYSERTSARSFRLMEDFFTELFNPQSQKNGMR